MCFWIDFSNKMYVLLQAFFVFFCEIALLFSSLRIETRVSLLTILCPPGRKYQLAFKLDLTSAPTIFVAHGVINNYWMRLSIS